MLGVACAAGTGRLVVRASDDVLAGRGSGQRTATERRRGLARRRNARAGRPRRQIVLDQRNLQFSPHVLAVSVGTQVEMPNSDRVFHNVFSFHDGKRFDLGLYPVGTAKVVTFDRPGLSRIFCNIHPTMAAYVLAVDSAYLAVSDARGQFAMAPVPQGSVHLPRVAARRRDDDRAGDGAGRARGWRSTGRDTLGLPRGFSLCLFCAGAGARPDDRRPRSTRPSACRPSRSRRRHTGPPAR